MSDQTVAERRPHPLASVPPRHMLFVLAIFTSAVLVFTVQPLVTRLVLPTLGGSPSVWNTAMVFFQAALLAGYGYAHLLQRLSSLRHQVIAHLALLVLAAVFLPLQISGVLGDPDTRAPIAWLIGTLALSVGVPFAVLSATAPLLQAWFARAHADEPEPPNPYALYAASNLGSFAALLAYPIVIEPLMRLGTQTISWTIGYGLFVALIVGLGLMLRREGRASVSEQPLAPSAPISWRERGIWVLLAAAPSSLMLGVTTHLSVDVASAPFLWVVPLALYLLTFVIAFQNRPAIPLVITLLIQGAAAAACTALLPFNTGEWAVLFGIHLVTFFFTALMCHQTLAARRPPADRLTEFYLWLSLGGVIGGAFNALIAPIVFDVVVEYPLVLVLVALARPWGRGRPSLTQWLWLAAVVPIAIVPQLIFAYLRTNAEIHQTFSYSEADRVARVILSAGAVAAFMIRDRALMYLAALAMISVSAHAIAWRYSYLESDRSFFGVMRIAEYPDPQLGDVRLLMHGTTLHGAQALDPTNLCRPMLYYAETTPIGQAMLGVQFQTDGAVIGVVGQGTGSMAAYKRESDRLTFFEIDPLVDRWARDPERFRFISDCARGEVDTVLGDARVSLGQAQPGTYDLLIIDAFSSDAVPTHLLTVEALQTYLRALKPTGVVLLHLSNRNLEITSPAITAAMQLNAPVLYQVYMQNPDVSDMQEASTEAVLIGASEAAIAPFAVDPRWTSVRSSGTPAWTDDHTDLFGALIRDIRR